MSLARQLIIAPGGLNKERDKYNCPASTGSSHSDTYHWLMLIPCYKSENRIWLAILR